MKSRCLNYILVVAALLLAVGCASIGNPSGGPRDEQPPRFVRANPAPGTGGVSTKIGRIHIDFDEIVNVKDAYSNVVVSPPSAQTPRVTSQGRRVTVTFPDTLASGTTYTINFGNSIEDNNESNPLENFSYTFSTGEVVDSLRIAGIVASARTLEPQQKRLVGVYRIPDYVPDSVYRFSQTDSLLFSRRFDRVTKTDDRGRFSIEGLPAGRYRIYSIDDTNNDFIYSLTEELAFSQMLITPSSQPATANDTVFNVKTGEVDTVLTRERTLFLPNDIILRSALGKRQQQYIKKYERIDSTRLVFVMGAALPQLPDIRLLGDSLPIYHYGVTEQRAENDSITVWLKDRAIIGTDTLRVAITYPRLDSLNNYEVKIDTLRLTTDRVVKREPRSSAKENRKNAKKTATDVLKGGDESSDDEENSNDNESSSGNDEKQGVVKDTGNQGKKGKRKKKDGGEQEEPAVKLLTINWDSGTQEVNKPFSFEFPSPLELIDTISLRLSEKVDTIWMQRQQGREIALNRDTLNPRRYYIEYPWQAGVEYKIEADSLAFTDIYGLCSGPEERTLKVRPDNEYGSLLMRLTDWPAEVPGFVELLDSSEKVLCSEQVKDGTVYFPYLLSGKYYLRVIHDRNGNGVWDSGDIVTGQQAEESYYYPKGINLKQNWNKDETWEVFATPVDRMKPEAILKNRPATTKRSRKSNTTTVPDDEEDE